ncbi:MAG: hypothetical protein J7K73_02505 [Nanoarchaeota archaeon]|nr:hypothetical protein [Nanoarchaeota archaeon]
MEDISIIPGIGEARKKILEENGYISISDIATADPEELVELGIPPKTAEEVIETAYELLISNMSGMGISEEVDGFDEFDEPEWTQSERYKHATQLAFHSLNNLELSFYDNNVTNLRTLASRTDEEVAGPLLSFYAAMESGAREAIDIVKKQWEEKIDESRYIVGISPLISSEEEIPLDMLAVDILMGYAKDVSILLEEFCRLYEKVAEREKDETAHLMYLLDEFVDFNELIKHYIQLLGNNEAGVTYRVVKELSTASAEELSAIGINKIIAEELIEASKDFLNQDWRVLLQKMIDKQETFKYISTFESNKIKTAEDIARLNPQQLVGMGVSYEIAEEMIDYAKQLPKVSGVVDVILPFAIDVENEIPSKRELENMCISDIAEYTPKELVRDFGFDRLFAENFIKAAKKFGSYTPITEIGDIVLKERRLQERYARELYNNGFKSISDIVDGTKVDTRKKPITRVGPHEISRRTGLDFTAATQLHDKAIDYARRNC